jgi:PAS domain-containing protein
MKSAANLAGRPEGEYRCFLTRAEFLRASDGTLLYWVEVNLDIDDAKRAENALRKSEKELRGVIDTIPAIVWSTLPAGSIETARHQVPLTTDSHKTSALHRDPPARSRGLIDITFTIMYVKAVSDHYSGHYI